MANTYVSLDTLKGTGVLNITGTVYDTRMLYLLEDVSREVDRYVARSTAGFAIGFYPIVATLYFDGPGSLALYVPDLVSVDALVEDTNEDGTFETTWAGTGIGGTDFILAPYAANPTAAYIQKPYTKVLVNRSSAGSQDSFLKGQRNYQIAGTWGYSFVTRDSGVDVGTTTGSISLTATSFVVTAGGTALQVGNLIYVDTELMYVRAVTTGTVVDVDRGVNGFTVGTHASGTSILVVQYPGPVQEAVIRQASRLWKGAQGNEAGVVGLDQTGQVAVFQGGLDGDVKALLHSYRRLVI